MIPWKGWKVFLYLNCFFPSLYISTNSFLKELQRTRRRNKFPFIDFSISIFDDFLNYYMLYSLLNSHFSSVAVWVFARRMKRKGKKMLDDSFTESVPFFECSKERKTFQISWKVIFLFNGISLALYIFFFDLEKEEEMNNKNKIDNPFKSLHFWWYYIGMCARMW